MDSSTGLHQDECRWAFLSESGESTNSVHTVPVKVDIEELLPVDTSDSQETEILDSQINRSKPKRISYTIWEKLDALRLLDTLGGNRRLTCRKLKISRKNLYRWIKQKDILMKLKDDKTNIRTKRRIRPVFGGKWPELEKDVKIWFDLQREQALQVNRSNLIAEAKRLAEITGIGDEFRCSNGWVTRFLHRHNISLRSPTNVGQRIPVNARELAMNFLTYIGDLRKKYSDYDRLIYAHMDEVPVWFDSPQNRTYDYVGNKNIFVRTTNHEKTRFTAVLATLSTGEKIKPMLIFKASNRRISREKLDGVIMTGSANGSMNSEIMEKWRTEVWSKRPNHIIDNINYRFSKVRTILIMDSFNVHKDNEILSRLDRLNNTEVAIIPGGMTKILQPADVVYNRSFKSLMRTKWQNWMEKGPFEYTKTGHRKHASYKQIASWVEEAWNEVPVEMITRSYKKCGIIDEDDSENFHLQLIDVLTGPSNPEKEGNQSSEPTGISDNEREEDD